MTPSREYTLKDLAIGTVHVAFQTPETGGQGTIIGPEGGTLTAADGTILTIPAGALARETVVAFASLAESDLRVAIPAGFQLLKAVSIDLTRATLALSAELAFPLPAGVTGDTQILVARVIELDGVLKLQAVGVGQVSGALLSSKGTVSGVSLPGITSGGTYVALRATTPVGFVAGTITDAAGATKAGVIVVSGSGLVDVSRSDGRYLVAATAGTATIIATDRATGQGASQTISVPSGRAASQPHQVQVNPPTVASVTPAAASRIVPLNSKVTVTFSQAIAKASLSASSLVLSGPTGPVEATLTLSPLGTEVTLYPAKALASQTPYSLVASQAIQNTHGILLPAPFISQFTTASAPPPPPPAGAITVSFPDEQGNVTVTATQGTATPDYLVVVLNVSSGTVASATVGANGGFSTSLFAMLGDELLVMIQDAAGSQTVVSPGPYRSADGQFVMTRAGGTLDTPEGISLTLAPSAVSQPVTLKVSPLTLDQVAAAIPSTLQFLGGLRLDTQGARFKTGAKVGLPIPAGVTIPTGAQPFLARLQTINGQLTPVLVDTLRVATGKLMTASPPFPGVQKDGDYVALLPTNPYPAVVTGTVVRDGTTPPAPIAGAVLKVDGIEVAATTDDKGKYALELFTTDLTKPTTFNLVAVDPTSGALRGATLTVPAWTVPAGGGTYTLDVALPSTGAGRDTTPPKIEISVDAPSLKGGRVALGDTVTVTVKATDDIGVRTETQALTKNGTSLQLTLGGASSSSTTSFVPTTPWEVIT
ncbi:MAG: Ig-like domain-containing protein, partial [candidate division NC10 bacterium]